jgi:hypothetical protein
MKNSFSVAAAAASIAMFAFAGTVSAAPGQQPAGPAQAKGVHTLGPANISGWAVVASDGTLVRGSNATGVIKIATGQYEVDMNSKLTKCSFVGGAGSTGAGSSGFGVVTTANRSGNPKGVYVEIFNQAGAVADVSFHLNVTC